MARNVFKKSIHIESDGYDDRVYVEETYVERGMNVYGDEYEYTCTRRHPMSHREYLNDVKYHETTHHGTMKEIFEAYADLIASRQW